MDTPSPSPSPDRPAPAFSPAAPGTVQLAGPLEPGQADLLGPAALGFLAELHRRFEPARQARLIARRVRAARFDAG
jgi:malate synthase